nr:hypothetical protein [uncultured Jannaschia sp.]
MLVLGQGYLFYGVSLPAAPDDLRPILADAAGGEPFLIGVQRYGPDGHRRNSAALLKGGAGEIAAVHDKHRLVPFGEFLPAQASSTLRGSVRSPPVLPGPSRRGTGRRSSTRRGSGPFCRSSVTRQSFRRTSPASPVRARSCT